MPSASETLSRLCQKKKGGEGIPVILIAPDWPRQMLYLDLVILLADSLLALQDHLLQGSVLPAYFFFYFNGFYCYVQYGYP